MGRKRQQSHGKQGTHRLYKDPNAENIVGVAGEIAFAEQFGFTIDEDDLWQRPWGDGGYDFELANGTTIDVKCARKPVFLLVKETDIQQVADVLVLGKFIDVDTIKWVGWTFGDMMKHAVMKDFGYRIRSYALPAEDLTSMDRLKLFLEKNGHYDCGLDLGDIWL